LLGKSCRGFQVPYLYSTFSCSSWGRRLDSETRWVQKKQAAGASIDGTFYDDDISGRCSIGLVWLGLLKVSPEPGFLVYLVRTTYLSGLGSLVFCVSLSLRLPVNRHWINSKLLLGFVLVNKTRKKVGKEHWGIGPSERDGGGLVLETRGKERNCY